MFDAWSAGAPAFGLPVAVVLINRPGECLKHFQRRLDHRFLCYLLRVHSRSAERYRAVGILLPIFVSLSPTAMSTAFVAFSSVGTNRHARNRNPGVVRQLPRLHSSAMFEPRGGSCVKSIGSFCSSIMLANTGRKASAGTVSGSLHQAVEATICASSRFPFPFLIVFHYRVSLLCRAPRVSPRAQPVAARLWSAARRPLVNPNRIPRLPHAVDVVPAASRHTVYACLSLNPPILKT